MCESVGKRGLGSKAKTESDRPSIELVSPWQELTPGWCYALGRGAAGEAWLVSSDPNGEISGLCGDARLRFSWSWQAIELTEDEQADDRATLRRAWPQL